MSRKITTTISFKIESTIEEWVKFFDIKEADQRHSEFDIELVFRGLSVDDPKELFAYISLQREIFKSFLKKIANGLKVTMLIYRLCKNQL